jgi:hypothetical protein
LKSIALLMMAVQFLLKKVPRHRLIKQLPRSQANNRRKDKPRQPQQLRVKQSGRMDLPQPKPRILTNLPPIT